MNNISQRLSELNLANKPTVVLTPNLLAQVSYLHHKVKGKEWSGFVLYKQEGSIEDINNMKLICEHIQLFNIGSETLTKFEDYDPFEMIDDLGEEALKYKIGVVHTHHGMDAFFSGTDTNDLHENAESYPFLLSLIVNYNHGGHPVAKIAFVGTDTFEERTLSTNSRLKDIKVTLNEKEKSKEVLVLCDCTIEYGLPEYFTTRYKTLKEKQDAPRPMYPNYGYPYGGGTGSAYGHNPHNLNSRVKNQTQREFDWDGDSDVQKDDWRGWEDQKKKKPTLFGEWRKKMGKKDKKAFKKLDVTEARLEEFLIKVINCDLSSKDINLGIALKRLDSTDELKDEGNKTLWLDIMEENLDKYIESEFGNLAQNTKNLLLEECEKTLRLYPTCELASEVADLFFNQIVEEVSEDSKKYN